MINVTGNIELADELDHKIDRRCQPAIITVPKTEQATFISIIEII